MLEPESDSLTSFQSIRDRLRDPLLTALTIILVLLIFVFAPLHAADIVHTQEIGVAIAVILVIGVLLMSGSMPAVVAMMAAIALSVLAAALPDKDDSKLIVLLNAVSWLTLGFALLWVVASRVFAPGEITYHRVIGAILLYLIIGLVFVSLFAAVGLMAPKAFSGIQVSDNPALASELIYFSFVTLTSIGYGDMYPVHPIARSLCNIEGILGQLYPATLLARLVTLELEYRRIKHGNGGGAA
jgi:hypothetical protein